jgi:alkylation response protein AidB-like acyl-CoA dehydrogenase
MDFSLKEEQKMIQPLAHDFAAKEIKPKAAESDLMERHPE